MCVGLKRARHWHDSVSLQLEVMKGLQWPLTGLGDEQENRLTSLCPTPLILLFVSSRLSPVNQNKPSLFCIQCIWISWDLCAAVTDRDAYKVPDQHVPTADIALSSELSALALSAPNPTRALASSEGRQTNPSIKTNQTQGGGESHL